MRNKARKKIIFMQKINIKPFKRIEYSKALNFLQKKQIKTICIEANCPNRYECFSKKSSAFLILGKNCTRDCRYCNVKKIKPEQVDKNEPKRIANAVHSLNLKYAVITSVARDDLTDGGARQFVKVINAIKKKSKTCKIEILIPDFNGNKTSLSLVLSAKPFVINHNIEAVKRIFKKVRPMGDYKTSLMLLKRIKEINPQQITKSGFMLGLGEKNKDMLSTLIDLKKSLVDIITIGQYLSPSPKHYPVKKYYSKKEFEQIKKIAQKVGFKKVFCGQLVRSSYHAEEAMK